MSEHAETPHDSALPHLTDDQVRDWTLQQKDEWWLKNVFKGDMPQLTIRSALTGMMLGGVLSLTNLYVGAKTGWTLGVGITSVILSFAMFKVFASLKLSSDLMTSTAHGFSSPVVGSRTSSRSMPQYPSPSVKPMPL